MKKLIASLLLAGLVSANALAIPARPAMYPMPQPDGTMVTVKLIGDEFYHYNTTSDGYTIMLNDDGAYVYAKLDGQRLAPTGVLAHDEGKRSAAELQLLSATPKYLVDAADVDQAHVRRAKRNVDLSNFDFSKFRGLVILIDFSDVKFRSDNPSQYYFDLFSSEELDSYYDPVTDRDVSILGSVRDYFNDQSDGEFNPPFDVYGPFTSNYKASQCNSLSKTIFTNALRVANSTVDFTKYDNNNDGKVDMVYFLVAGYASSTSGNNSGYLWPHASNLSRYNLSYDGKKIDRYASSCELYGAEAYPSTVTVEGIGTVCHEFTHVLGLPDFYDTDYEKGGGQSHDPGGWDVMAGGNDYDHGRMPVGFSLFERYALGWAKAKNITATGQYTLNPVNTHREGYILRTPVDGEFFVLENRQKTSWDTYLPGHGMLVTRVDSTNVGVWTANKLNVDPTRNYFELLRAGNTRSGDLSSDPFPGTSSNPMITNETSPSLTTWEGYANDFNLVGISENDGIISFTVVDDGYIQQLVEDFEGMPVSTGTTDTDVKGVFATWSFNKCGVRAPGEDKASGENSVMMKMPSHFYMTTPIYYNSFMASLTVYNSGAYAAKYSLETSVDDGATWIKAMGANGQNSVEVPAKTTRECYWNLNTSNHKPVLFRIGQVGGNKNAATYVDNFRVFYTGKEGGPVDYPVGDVNGDMEIGIADVNAVLDIILGGEADPDTTVRADVNGDGEVGIADANAVLDLILN